jgi:hypothetical protein
MRGRENVLAYLRAFWEAFPEGRLALSRVFGEGFVAAAEGRGPGHGSARRLPVIPVADVPLLA